MRILRDPRFGATALDEELRFHFEFLGSHWEKKQPMMLQLLGGKVRLGFRQVFTAGLCICLYMCLLDLLVSRCGVSEFDIIKLMSKWF